MSDIAWDAFISYAFEDKEEVVMPLADLLISSGLKIWLDKSEIFIGLDSAKFFLKRDRLRRTLPSLRVTNIPKPRR